MKRSNLERSIMESLQPKLDNILNEWSNPGVVDNDAVREMVLYFENNEPLWRRAEAIIRSLNKKIAKGIEVTIDRLETSSMIDTLVRDALKSYAKEFSSFYVSTETRKQMKHEFSDVIMNRLDDYRESMNEGFLYESRMSDEDRKKKVWNSFISWYDKHIGKDADKDEMVSMLSDIILQIKKDKLDRMK